MNLAFETLMTTFLASFLLFLITCILFANSKHILVVGYPTLTFICVLSIMRLIFPFEFPFTRNIRLGEICVHIAEFFRKKYIHFLTIEFSLWDIGIIIWLTGIIVYLYKYINNYRKDKILIDTLGIHVSNNKKYSAILASICQNYQLNYNFNVYELPGLSSPMIFSVYKPCILLPAQNEYTDKELYLIFQHEIGHFYYHHLLYQFLIDLFSIVYWWNPFNKHIKQQIDALLEMSIDHIFSVTADETFDYLSCLLNVKKKSVKQQLVFKSNSSLSMNNLEETILEKRFQLLTHSQKRRHFLSFFLIIISVVIFIFSYCFTLRGYSVPKELKNNEIFALTVENSYAISNKDGTYDIYFYGEYLETVNSLKEYELVPIYTEKEIP